MRKSSAGWGTAVLFAVVVAGAGSAGGTSYNPLTPGNGSAPTPVTAGATVFLFHGGSVEAREATVRGCVLAVQRPGMDAQWHVVGKVRVDGEAGTLCFRAEVVEGELLPHDVVPAGAGGLLLITSDAPCQLRPLP